MTKLKKVMKQNGLSENETARRVGISQSVLNRISHTELTPNLKTAAKIVAAFEGAITYDDLLGKDARNAARKVRGICVA